MAPLVTSQTLVDAAQAWANNLAARDAFEHSLGQVGPYGENLYVSSTTASPNDIPAVTAIQRWFSEFVYYNHEPIYSDPANFANYGHFTQLIWPNTLQQGCAFTDYSVGIWNKRVVVCEYNPPGNIVGQVVNYSIPN
jgi:hypothetical protein